MSGMEIKKLQPSNDSNMTLTSDDAMPVIEEERERVETSIGMVREFLFVVSTAIGAFTFCGAISTVVVSLILGFSGAESVFAWFGAIGSLAYLGSYVVRHCLEKTSMTWSACISLTFFVGMIIGLAFVGHGLSWFAVHGQASSIWIPLLAHSVTGLSGAGFVLLAESAKKKKSLLVKMKEEDVNGLIPPTSSN